MQTFPIIEKLGGREKVFELLKSAELIKTIDAIRMWIQRGTIPGNAQRELMAEADRRMLGYDASDFAVSEVESEQQPGVAA